MCVHVCTDVEEEEQGNDWLFTVIADIITAHNDMVELPRQVASQPFKRLLPQQQSTAYPTEIATANCIIPHFKMYVAHKSVSISMLSLYIVYASSKIKRFYRLACISKRTSFSILVQLPKHTSIIGKVQNYSGLHYGKVYKLLYIQKNYGIPTTRWAHFAYQLGSLKHTNAWLWYLSCWYT